MASDSVPIQVPSTLEAHSHVLQADYYHDSMIQNGRVLANPAVMNQPTQGNTVKPSRSFPGAMLSGQLSAARTSQSPPLPRGPSPLMGNHGQSPKSSRGSQSPRNARGQSPVSRGSPTQVRMNGMIQKSPLRRTVHATPTGYGKPRSPYNIADLQKTGDPSVRARTSSFTNVTPRKWTSTEDSAHIIANQHTRSPARTTMYRSNSSLEFEEADDKSSPLKREYGSASSLDVMSTSGESFFAMLKDFETDNLDQRSPGPEQLNEYLCGKSITLPPNIDPSVARNGYDDTDSPKSKSRFVKLKDKDKLRLWTKSIRNDTFFKKLGGGNSSKMEVNDSGSTKSLESDAEARVEEKLRRKAFAHHDCLSIGVNLIDVVKNRNSLNRRRNTTTGASAASMTSTRASNTPDGSTEELNSDEQSDPGDGKNSELILSCPFFRNEIGGEEVQDISLNRSNSSKVHRNNVPLYRSSTAAGLSVVDSCKECDSKRHTIERVDDGALFYRKYFLDKGRTAIHLL